MDAIQLLKNDHKEMKALLGELAETTTRSVKRRNHLVQKIQVSLDAHMTIEEEIFYPAFRDAGGREHKQMYYEALEEHRAAGELVLPDLGETEAASDAFSGRAKVLKELIEHHMREEEREMFKEAKELIDPSRLKELGTEMQARKEKLMYSSEA